MKSKGKRAKLLLIYTLNNFIEFIRVPQDTERIISEIGQCTTAVKKKREFCRNATPFVFRFLHRTFLANLESDSLGVVASASSIASRCYTTPQLLQL